MRGFVVGAGGHCPGGLAHLCPELQRSGRLLPRGTIDKPDARYNGPKLMATKLHLEPRHGDLMEWRCAGGAVLACLYGANIPCNAKAVTDWKPTPPISDFCRDNPDAAVVPMVVTGHETVVSWACHAGNLRWQGCKLSMTRAMQKRTGGP